MAVRKREGQQLLLRFAEGSDLRDRLQEVAKANNRTMTQEILFRLEASLSEERATNPVTSESGLKFLAATKGQSIAKLDARLNELEQRVKALEGR
ncbi:Arc family DNA-binding protein [Roseinatronobacter sp. S2]|uniref:Arc family DNA-binding protein n=1 Tax=Roseinatronobacter sp. S2 TaxID=3035471 RepID=UPI00240ECD0B|nr:Arc family DNA-binding protein [Roseinatronobacter sp. S2]WFE75658.1 Arc family DNA-binding protein [Roseinatronobacter sp. S2]